MSPQGTVTVVGGKLTTYRAMAEETVDAVVAEHRLAAAPCRTREIPLVGAASHEELDSLDAPRHLVARYGMEALDVVAEADGDPASLTPVVRGITPAELRFGVRHEGALDVSDLLERRTRIGLVPADGERAEAAAERALSEVGR